MVSILVISLIFLSTFLSLWQALYWILLSKTQEFLSEKFCQVPKPNGAHKNKWNGPGYMAKLKGIIIYPYFVKYVVCLIDDYKTNFNSTVIWSRFSHVSVFFRINDMLVPWTSLVKGLHVWTIFLPVLDNYWDAI